MSYPELPDKPENVVFDLDDFQFTLNNGQVGDLSLAYLYYINSQFPMFKCTLFAIPNRCNPYILEEVAKHDWIELAVHGWQHDTNYECAEMTKEEALELLDNVETAYGDIFVKGFKAPGWQISDGVYEALLERGYWVADHIYNEDRRPKELPAYTLAHPWCIHGHTWDIQGVPLDQQNGIRQMIEERGLLEKWTPETKFHFISEVIGKEVIDAQDDSNKPDTDGLHIEKPTDTPQVQPNGYHESGGDRPVNVWDL